MSETLVGLPIHVGRQRRSEFFSIFALDLQRLRGDDGDRGNPRKPGATDGLQTPPDIYGSAPCVLLHRISMPYTLANPDRPRRHPPLTPSRSSSASSHDTSPSAPESQEMFTSTAGRSSMHSFLSSSDHTVVSEYPRRLSHEKSSHYPDDSSSIYKALPDIPLSAIVISKPRT